MNQDIKIVSADDHLQEAPDLWQARLPERLREKAPRIVTLPDGHAAWAWGDNPPHPFGWDVWGGREIAPDRDTNLVRWEEIHPGTYDAKARLAAMDQDGIHASILYPNFARAFIGAWLTAAKKDSELNLACVRAYNDYIGEFCQTDPKRLVPIGIIPMESVETAVVEVERMSAIGLRGGLLPPQPADGSQWNDPQFEPLWAAAAAGGIILNLHIGKNPSLIVPESGPGAYEVAGTLTRMANAIPFTTMLWSGVFDRYPDLKLISVEGDISWLVWIRHRAEWVYRNNEWRWHKKPDLKNPPSYYLGRNLAATFQEDPAGIAARDLIGVDAICWAADFPHPGTTWPNSRAFLEEQFAGVPEEDVRKIVSENAARIYEIDLN
jgi:predicted TIM-barrel fold metal-dependent hydrolase